ncbi:Copia protein [Durusdinium trenchii]|uniref:Copia protein n=1 Tax=Durusdinium trenchii TaxID=1381693 RepID=A0ABP0K8L2_9DINO
MEELLRVVQAERFELQKLLNEAQLHRRPREGRRGLVPVTVELASGSTTLFRVKEHNTLLTKDNVEVIVPLHRLVKLGYRLQWTSAGVKITHPQSGRIECALRGGCPVLSEKQALALLDIMEKEDKGELMLDEEIRNWWSSRFPDVPQEVWNHMRGQDHYNPEECPWNRRQRRRHARAPGVIIHLYSGKDTKTWTAEDWNGYEILNVDIALGTQLPREDLDDEEARELDGEEGDPLPIGEEDEDERPVPDDEQVKRSRAVERGRAALAEAGCRSYAAVEASAEGASGHAGEESQGYRVRLQGYEKRGETGTIEGGGTRALAGEGLIEEDPSQMPVWLGIETAVTGGNRESDETDSSHSLGSFEKV